MKKLILHIGMHKTGTSTLQNSLFKARPALAKQGVFYPPMMANHSIPFYRMFSENNLSYRMNIIQGITQQEQLDALTKQHRINWTKCLETVHTPLTIISAEDLSRMPLLDVGALKAFLDQYFDDITVIAYCRPPNSYIESLILQRIKTGIPLANLLEAPPFPDYRAKLEPYMKAFGKEKVIIKPFSRSLLKNGCIVSDFLDQIGLGSTKKHVAVINSNVSLNLSGLLFMETCNRMYPHLIDNSKNPKRNKSLISFAARLRGPKYKLHSSILDKISTALNADVEWLNSVLGLDIRTLDTVLSDDETMSKNHILESLKSPTLMALAEFINCIDNPVKLAADRKYDWP